MALVGILSTQLVEHLFVRGAKSKSTLSDESIPLKIVDLTPQANP
jgi:hypothetical protein